MNDLRDHLIQRFSNAYDRQGSHMRDADPLSIDDLNAMTLVTAESVVAQWAASLEIKTSHDLMRSSIDAIR